MTLKKIVAAALCSGVAVLALIVLAWQLLPLLGTDYAVKSRKPSPDGQWTISELQSYQDGRQHAPYGTYLVLARDSNIRKPEQGHVFFAGYCHEPLVYAWRSVDEVVVQCTTSQPEIAVRTRAQVMYGIRVSFELVTVSAPQ
jgi:hypothetical protein